MILTICGRRFLIHDREEWQDPRYPVTGPKPYHDLVHHAVVHWPGASDNWVPDTDVPAHLRWAQSMYLLDPNRGYSYGYGFVCGPNPVDWDADPIISDIWEVRGTDIRIASNDGDNGEFGDYSAPNFNGRSISLQIMCSTKHPATDDQIEQARWWVAAMDDEYDELLTVIPHRTSDATSCPGDHVTSKIPHIATRPAVAPTPPPDPPQENDMSVYLAYSDTRTHLDGTTNPKGLRHLWRGDKIECFSLGDPDDRGSDAYALVRRDFTAPNMAGVYRNPVDQCVITNVDQIATLTPNQIRLDLGIPRSANV